MCDKCIRQSSITHLYGLPCTRTHLLANPRIHKWAKTRANSHPTFVGKQLAVYGTWPT